MSMHFVYFLKSKKVPNYIYVGTTSRLQKRLEEHNAPESHGATKPYQPLELVAYVAVQGEQTAKDLEKYLKSGSGKAIAKKRFFAT